jgi:hypothetical protein
MMRELTVVGTIMVMLLAANLTHAGVCEIVNGSFEDDGPINDITTQDPNGWVVSVPAGKFVGKADASWSTDGNFSLHIFSQWFEAFAAGDVAAVSQQVYLTDVNEIRFDVNLDTYSGFEWDPNMATAVVLVDDVVVWEPNAASLDIRGVYLDQTYTVGEEYRDDNLHKLSFGLRVNVDTEDGFFEFYRLWWDSVDCTLYCNGGGLLAGDFDRDCVVDMNDLKLAADAWLDEVDPYDRRNPFRGDNLAGSGTINFYDFAVYAEGWTGDAADLGMFAEQWLNEVALDEQYNLFKDDDVNPSGIVNFFDLAILADTWLGSSYIEDEEVVTPDGNGN